MKYSKFFVLVLSVCTLGAVAAADPNIDLFNALKARDFEEATRIVYENPIDPNFMGKGEVGLTLLYFAANLKQWALVEHMLDHPLADINAGPQTFDLSGSTVLWIAAFCGRWDLVERMLLRRNANVNASPVNGEMAGANVLWIAVKAGRWDIVDLLLQHFEPDVNSAPAVRHSETALWLTALARQWPLVERMLLCRNADCNAGSAKADKRNVAYVAAVNAMWKLVDVMVANPRTNVNVGPLEGIWKGVNTLLWALRDDQFETVRIILANHPEADLLTRVLSPENRSENVRDILEQKAPNFVLNQLIVTHMNKETGATSLREHLAAPLPVTTLHCARISERTRFLEALFRQAATIFTDISNVPCVRECSLVSGYSCDVRRLLVPAFLRVQDPDLARIPTCDLMRLVSQCQRAEVVDYNEQAADLVACQVLNAVEPMSGRDHRTLAQCKEPKERKLLSNKKARVFKVRRWIKGVVFDAMEAQTPPRLLVAPVRARVVEILSAISLRTVSLKWIKEKLVDFVIPQVVDVEVDEAEAEPVRSPSDQSRKRERPDEGIVQEEPAILRARLTREAIAAQPGMPMAEINLCVDEMIGGSLL